MAYRSDNTTTYQLDIPLNIGAVRQTDSRKHRGEIDAMQDDSKPNDERRKARVVDDDRSRGLEAGASDFIRKPVTEAQLRSLVSDYEGDERGSVLIIDDDDDAADLLGRTVRRLGFDTRRAIDGESGLEAVRTDPPRAILLDLDMPDINGFRFIEALSREGEFDQIPVIVVSARRLSVAQHHTLVSAGAKFYLKGKAAPREIAAGLREAVA